MRRVVACIDNSVASRPVLAAANALAPVLGASVEAVHVAEDGDTTVRAAADDAHVPLRVVHGDPLDELVAVSAAGDVVAVAIGVRDIPSGRRAAGHVALALANRVDAPVLVVPPDAQPPEHIHRVLIAMEGTPDKMRPLKNAVELASAAGLELVVIHVDDESSIPSFSDQVQHEVTAYTHEFLARFLPGAPSARLELRIGVPVDEILGAAESTEPDLLALGWPQTEDPVRGPVAHELLERCPVPMLLVALASS
jgi:hypothetical protein